MQQALQDQKSRKEDEDRKIQVNNRIKQAAKEKNFSRNEEAELRRKFENQMLSEREKYLNRMRLLLKEPVYNDLFRFFDFLKHNDKEKNQSKCYLTKNSIRNNLRKYFGHETKFLDKRLYKILAQGQKNVRIYFEDFIQQFYTPLFDSPPIEKAIYLFRLLDFDNDGYLDARDLDKAEQFVDKQSDFGAELSKLTTYYVKVYLKS